MRRFGTILPGLPLHHVLLLLGTVAVLPTNLTAQSPVTGSAEVAFRSKYLFAGIPFAAKQVTQPKVTVGTGSFTFNGFATYDHDADDVTEADLYGDYYAQLAPAVGIFVGAALYNFKFATGWEATPELYGGVVLTAPLNPTLYFAHDFDLGDGTHVTLMLSQDVPLGASGASLGFAGNLDYNDSYWEDFWLVTGSESGFSFADVSVALNIPVGPLTLSPMVLIQRAIHDDFIDEELFGVTAAFTF